MKKPIYVTVLAVAIALTGYALWRGVRQTRDNSSETRAEKESAMIGKDAENLTSSDMAAGQQLPGTYRFPGILPETEIQNKIAIVKTAKGEIRFEILAGEGPKAASNFIYLAKEGYYDGLKFHRVEPWVVQGGDPNCGSTSSPSTATGRCGTGGPGYKFEDEPVRLPYNVGVVAMANAGPNTNGSQFFIMKKELSPPLPPNYTIFGRVISEMDVVQEIAAGDAMEKVEIKDK